MKKLISLVLFSFCLNTYGQKLPHYLPKVKTGWERIKSKKVGSIDIPILMMKLQDDPFKNEAIVVYQKDPKDYAVVMLETIESYYEDFNSLNDVMNFSPSEIQELNIINKSEILKGLKLTYGMRFLKWYPLKIEIINGMSSIHLRYERQFLNQPIVTVHHYIFHNKTKLHTLILSHRKNKTAKWKYIYQTILKSLRINKI